MTNSSENQAETWKYHLSLWMGALSVYAILDFAKRVDDVMSQLNYGERASNLVPCMLLLWILAYPLSAISLFAERSRFMITTTRSST